jgi:hypothetical protein
MTDGFIDFSFGSGDDALKKKSSRYKPETGVTDRVSFVWFQDYDGEGMPAEGAAPKFAGCERSKYDSRVGVVLLTPDNRDEILRILRTDPQHRVASVICVWPTDKDGELDVASFKAGKGWKVQPWVFDPGKYNEIKRVNKRFPLHEHDLSMTCTDGTFHKMTFTPEGKDTLLSKYLSAKNEDLQAVGRKIIAEARRCSEGIYRDLARSMTPDEVREAIGDEVSPSAGGGSHTDANVDNLLDDVL